MRVKIIHECHRPGWYANLLGKEFEVVEWGRHYVLKEDYDLGHNAMWRHIDKDDAIELQPCGHPVSAIVSSGTTSYCRMCEEEGR